MVDYFSAERQERKTTLAQRAMRVKDVSILARVILQSLATEYPQGLVQAKNGALCRAFDATPSQVNEALNELVYARYLRPIPLFTISLPDEE